MIALVVSISGIGCQGYNYKQAMKQHYMKNHSCYLLAIFSHNTIKMAIYYTCRYVLYYSLVNLWLLCADGHSGMTVLYEDQQTVPRPNH